jgi:hypothetical protein
MELEIMHGSAVLRVLGVLVMGPLKGYQRGAKNHQGRSSGTTMVGAITLAVFLAALTQALEAQQIDRLIAAVNGKVITESDLLLARDLNAILSLGQSHALPSRAEEVDRLIDLELMRQELESFPMAPEDQGKIQARMQELKDTYAEIGGLSGLLRSLGLQESELLDYLRLQDSILRFVDFRFRPFASVSEQEVQQYYKEKLVPSVQQAGAPVAPLAGVTGKIEEILREEKVNASMNRWIQDVRRHARVDYFLDDAEPPWGKKR